MGEVDVSKTPAEIISTQQAHGEGVGQNRQVEELAVYDGARAEQVIEDVFERMLVEHDASILKKNIFIADDAEAPGLQQEGVQENSQVDHPQHGWQLPPG